VAKWIIVVVMFENVDFTQYEPHIDFVYTTLLMIWGGSLVGIGMIVVPFIFKHFESKDQASNLTTKILKRQDYLIRGVAISMLIVFYFKSQLHYSYQGLERAMYVFVLHFFIIGKIISRQLDKVRNKIDTFDDGKIDGKEMKKFKIMHRLVRYFYIGQFIGVVILLYLHAFGRSDF